MARHLPSSRLPAASAVLVLFIALLAGCAPAGSTAASTQQPRRGAPTGAASPAVPQSRFYGVNFDLAGFEPFARADTGPLLAALEPSTIRWPGGTEADFYNWRSGENEEKPGQVPFTLGDLAAAYRATGAVPIFDLNVLAQANRTDPADQVAMLKAARQLGLPVDYVEVGNELYSNGPGFAQAFPNGAAYARTVAIYVQALHRAFPGVQVAADAIPFPMNARQQSWDQELLAGATGPGAPDALIVHFYPGLIQRPFTSSDLPALFADTYSSISELSNAVRGLGGKPVWLTEYNMRGPYKLFREEGPSPAERDFAHELYLAAFAAMLPRVAGLALADNWTAFADGLYGAWQNPSSPRLSPGGQAVEMVDTAARGAVSSQPVLVPGAPSLPGGMPGVVGQRFVRPGATTTALLVNLTPARALLPAGGWLTPGAAYEQVTGDPLASLAGSAVPISGSVGPAGLPLPPYSVTLVGVGLGLPSG
jgi:hypothetical protein